MLGKYIDRGDMVRNIGIRIEVFKFELLIKARGGQDCICTWSVESTSPEMIAYICRIAYFSCEQIYEYHWNVLKYKRCIFLKIFRHWHLRVIF